MDAGSELMLTPGDSEKHYGPPAKVGAYGGQVINGDLVEVQLAVGPVGPQTNPVIISPVLPFIIRMEVGRILTLVFCGVRAVVVGKALKLPLSGKTMHQKTVSHHGRNCRN